MWTSRKSFYSSKDWADKKKEIYIRDKGVCQDCKKIVEKTIIKNRWGGTNEIYGNIDHIIEIDDNNYNDYNLSMNNDNLQLLCLKCHAQKTRGIGKNLIINGNIDFERRDEKYNIFEIDKNLFD